MITHNNSFVNFLQKLIPKLNTCILIENNPSPISRLIKTESELFVQCFEIFMDYSHDLLSRSQSTSSIQSDFKSFLKTNVCTSYFNNENTRIINFSETVPFHNLVHSSCHVKNILFIFFGEQRSVGVFAINSTNAIMHSLDSISQFTISNIIIKGKGWEGIIKKHGSHPSLSLTRSLESTHSNPSNIRKIISNNKVNIVLDSKSSNDVFRELQHNKHTKLQIYLSMLFDTGIYKTLPDLHIQPIKNMFSSVIKEINIHYKNATKLNTSIDSILQTFTNTLKNDFTIDLSDLLINYTNEHNTIISEQHLSVQPVNEQLPFILLNINGNSYTSTKGKNVSNGSVKSIIGKFSGDRLVQENTCHSQFKEYLKNPQNPITYIYYTHDGIAHISYHILVESVKKYNRSTIIRKNFWSILDASEFSFIGYTLSKTSSKKPALCVNASCCNPLYIFKSISSAKPNQNILQINRNGYNSGIESETELGNNPGIESELGNNHNKNKKNNNHETLKGSQSSPAAGPSRSPAAAAARSPAAAAARSLSKSPAAAARSQRINENGTGSQSYINENGTGSQSYINENGTGSQSPPATESQNAANMLVNLKFQKSPGAKEGGKIPKTGIYKLHKGETIVKQNKVKIVDSLLKKAGYKVLKKKCKTCTPKTKPKPPQSKPKTPTKTKPKTPPKTKPKTPTKTKPKTPPKTKPKSKR